ncbi:hypothetical protein AM593_03351, partial [Mytilus galloprovincialis]
MALIMSGNLKNTTESNGFDDWNKGQPNDIEVDTCVVMFNLKWYDAYKSACRLDDHYFICESRMMKWIGDDGV